VLNIKEIIKQIPILGDVAAWINRRLVVGSLNPDPFPGSAAYWEKRYSDGGSSGAGSYGILAKFKADVLNEFVAKHHVQNIIEFGCGDGHQLGLANYPTYIGFDVSNAAISRCQKLFKSDHSKSFRLSNEYNGEKSELTLSLDVIYHLVEDDVFEHYMRTLFEASSRYVIIYASDYDDDGGPMDTHIKHRMFTRWIRNNLTRCKLVEQLPNRHPYLGNDRKGSISEFFIYEKT